MAELPASLPRHRQAGSGDVVNLPNAVTAARLLGVPLAVWLAARHQWGWAFAVFAAAGVSDGLDGFLARRRGPTALGALLDPLADKALLVSMFVTLGVLGMLPPVLVVLVVCRDLLIAGGVASLWLRRRKLPIRPLPVGKANTALQILLVGLTLLLAASGLSVPLLHLALVWLVALAAVASAAAYVRAGWRAA